MGKRVILLLFFFIQQVQCQATMQDPELELLLKVGTDTLRSGRILPLQLTITNTSFHRGSILVPFAQNTGTSLFQLRVFKAQGDLPSELVFVSSTELQMDTSRYKSTASFYSLEPGEHFSLPLFINDHKNSDKRIESSIGLPDLEPGDYSIHVVYNPEVSAFFKYAFKESSIYDPIPEDDVSDYPDHFNWLGELVSNAVNVTVPSGFTVESETAPCKCSVCRAIRSEKWKRVQRKWDHRSQTTQHTSILWEYPWSQTILSSLPSYAGYEVIFETNSGIVYTSFTYQIGKIFPFRSVLSRLFHLVGFRRSPIRSSTVQHTSLHSLFIF